MMLLAVDVGMGTQDILLFDDGQRIENCIKMVLPSQTMIVARRIQQATAEGRDILLTGHTMGGGPSGSAVRKHIQAGHKVYATEKAALTLHDNLERVAGMGILIIDEQHAGSLDAVPIIMSDLDTGALGTTLALFGTDLPRDFAVAVQDHGESPHLSNRVFRFSHFKRMLDEGGELERFAYLDRVPAHLTRMASVLGTLKREDNHVLLMDTGPAAICGAMESEEPAVVLNVGNGHTMAAVVAENRILALLEHHTRQVDVKKLDDYVVRLCDGALGFDEVFEDGGHGCHITEAVGFSFIGAVVVTGPNRHIMEGSALDVKFAAPHGDMMLTGCFGLVEMFRKKLGLI